MRRRLTSLIAIAALSGLTACGGSQSLFSTGSIFGGKAAKLAAPGKPGGPKDPLARPIQVAWVSARAIKCGFYFDPARLKQTFLAAEAQRGFTSAELRRVETAYDYSLKSTTDKISGQASDAYCNNKTATAIRRDLQRHLAGDYTPTNVKKEPEKSFFSLPENKLNKMNRDEVLNQDWN